MTTMEAFDLEETYIHLQDGPDTPTLRGGDEFWETIESNPAASKGRIVCLFRFTEDWPTWEVHPAGDEVVFLLSGSVDLILDEPSGERIMELRGRSACIVPRGVWHTARVHEPSEVLHVTRGAGTRNRPV